MNVTILAISYLLENPKHYYNITRFPMICYGQRKVKTYPYLFIKLDFYIYRFGFDQDLTYNVII